MEGKIQLKSGVCPFFFKKSRNYLIPLLQDQGFYLVQFIGNP